MTYKQVLEDQSAPIVALLLVVTHQLGVESYHWEPEMLRFQLNEEFDMELTEQQSDRIQAAILLLTTDKYENNPNAFETMTHLFNGKHATFDALEPLEVEEMVSGMADAYLTRHEKIEFSPEVRAYAGRLFYDYGFSAPPDMCPDAILPAVAEKVECNNDEKNASLNELFAARVEHVKQYLDKID